MCFEWGIRPDVYDRLARAARHEMLLWWQGHHERQQLLRQQQAAEARARG